MGLGKTVELLACIFAHRRPYSADCSVSSNIKGADQIKRHKRERVECICGAASVTSAYQGIWIQCDICDAWQHASCVGYSPKEEMHVDDDDGDVASNNEKGTLKPKNRRKKKDRYCIAETEEKYICTLCLELIEAAQTNISSNATLIVCPSPILAQWHSEIIRYDFFYLYSSWTVLWYSIFYVLNIHITISETSCITILYAPISPKLECRKIVLNFWFLSKPHIFLVLISLCKPHNVLFTSAWFWALESLANLNSSSSHASIRIKDTRDKMPFI